MFFSCLEAFPLPVQSCRPRPCECTQAANACQVQPTPVSAPSLLAQRLPCGMGGHRDSSSCHSVKPRVEEKKCVPNFRASAEESVSAPLTCGLRSWAPASNQGLGLLPVSKGQAGPKPSPCPSRWSSFSGFHRGEDSHLDVSHNRQLLSS